MTLAPLLLVASVGGLVSLAAGRWGRGGRIGTILGLAILALALVVAVTTPASVRDPVANDLRSPLDALLEPTPYVRLMAILWAACGLVLATLAALTGRVPGLAGATLVGLAAAVVALASSDLVIAAMAAIVAGLGGLLVSAPEPEPGESVDRAVAGPRRPRALGPVAGPSAISAVAARELRSVVLAGIAVVAGAVLVGIVATRPPGSEGGAAGLVQAAPVVGAAALAIAGGVAVRSGAIPFHLWAARVADVAPAAALPLLLAWTPIVLAAVAVAAWDARVAPLGLPLDAERAVLVAVGVLTLAAGALAALVQDDLEHIVGYLVIADGGLVLFGLATTDPVSVAPSLAWLVILATSKSALGAWAVAIAARFATRRLPELRGWARRAPILGLALVLVAVATFGLPGWLAWDLRRSMPSLASGEPWGTLFWLVALAVVVPYARVIGAGLDRPTSTVAQAPGDVPVGVPMPVLAGRRARDASLHVGSTLATAVRANRALVVSGIALASAILAVVVAAGGLDLAAAASVAPPALPGSAFD